MSEKNGVLTTCWGSCTWIFIHSVAWAYNPRVDRDNYFNFFMNLGNVLPCEECRRHYSQNVKKDELFRALESNESFFKWVYDLHNLVNKQTGVPESQWPSYELIKQKYNSFKASCSELPGICGSTGNKTLQKKIRVVEQFGAYTEDNLPYIIAMVILIMLLLVCGGYIYHNRKKLGLTK